MTQRRPLGFLLALALVSLSTSSLRADIRAEEKSKIEFGGMLGRMFNVFGGKSARDGVVSTVAVKGDRKATMNEAAGQIVDLSEEKVYDLDLKKKTYKVTTFAEIRRRMEEAQKKAQDDAKKEEGKPAAGEAQNAPPQKQLEVDFDVRNTGQKKSVNGFDAREAVVTVTVREKGKTLEQGGGLVMSSDMWLAPTIKEMKEIRDFDVRYAQKLYGPMMAGVPAEQMAAVIAMYPMLKEAMTKMSAEGGKIEGTPVMTVTTVDAVKSEEQLAADAKQSEERKTQERGSVGGLLGGFARRAAAKKMGGGDEAGQARATILTNTSEVLKVATAVAPQDLAIPAGFKESK
jgi:hypothetical protein